MPATSIICGNTTTVLHPSPINPTWILEGKPIARSSILSRSGDLSAFTAIWECEPGVFMWHYDSDETIHILEGAITLEDGVTLPRRLGPGDIVFFPAGAVVKWTVETRTRKLAFFRRPLPKIIVLAKAILRRAKHMGKRTDTTETHAIA